MNNNVEFSDIQYILNLKDNNVKHRNHISPTLLSMECKRRSFLEFYWCSDIENYSVETMNLFMFGKKIEGGIVEQLSNNELITYEGSQHPISFLDNYGLGYVDGIVTINNVKYVLEIKTVNQATYETLEKKRDLGGVREIKYDHFKQMQLYMHCLNIDKAIYYAINRNNGKLYIEIIDKCKDTISELTDTANRIMSGINNFDYPAKYICKKYNVCPMYDICHNCKLPNINCRTCSKFTIAGNGLWKCGLTDQLLSIDDQSNACKNYIMKSV